MIKLAEVDVSEYATDTQLWSSYTFRIFVDKAGKEGELSDSAGIILTPE